MTWQPSEEEQKIIATIAGGITDDDIRAAQKLTDRWRHAMPHAPVRVVFIACLHMLMTMGPTYMRLMAYNLTKQADDAEEK